MINPLGNLIFPFVRTVSYYALTGTLDEKLEKVATQRWIANYTNSLEAWAIVRDTGYPSSALVRHRMMILSV